MQGQGPIFNKSAIDEFKAILDYMDKQNVRALTGLAWSLGAQDAREAGRSSTYDVSMERFAEAERLHPQGEDLARLNNNKAWVYMFHERNDKYQEAKELLLKSRMILIDLKTKSGDEHPCLLPDCLNNLSWVCFLLDDDDNAIKYAVESVQEFHMFGWAYVSLGKAYQRKADRCNSMHDFSAAKENYTHAHKAFLSALHWDSRLASAEAHRKAVEGKISELNSVTLHR